MRKITVITMVTLDGVMQAPGGPDEDKAGRFKYGGWTAPFSDEAFNSAIQKELEHRSDYLLGRKTFEIWEDYWPEHGHFWPGINSGTKYVLSKTRKESNWKNSAFLKSLAGIKKLKNSKGPDIQVWGSSEVVHLLLKHDLVDELRLKIYPVILGKGKKLFDDGSIPATFTLQDSLVTSKGIVMATYKRPKNEQDRKVKTGNVG